jgi:hypothetical protein
MVSCAETAPYLQAGESPCHASASAPETVFHTAFYKAFTIYPAADKIPLHEQGKVSLKAGGTASRN